MTPAEQRDVLLRAVEAERFPVDQCFCPQCVKGADFNDRRVKRDISRALRAEVTELLGEPSRVEVEVYQDDPSGTLGDLRNLLWALAYAERP